MSTDIMKKYTKKSHVDIIIKESLRSALPDLFGTRDRSMEDNFATDGGGGGGVGGVRWGRGVSGSNANDGGR